MFDGMIFDSSIYDVKSTVNPQFLGDAGWISTAQLKKSKSADEQKKKFIGKISVDSAIPAAPAQPAPIYPIHNDLADIRNLNDSINKMALSIDALKKPLINIINNDDEDAILVLIMQ